MLAHWTGFDKSVARLLSFPWGGPCGGLRGSTAVGTAILLVRALPPVVFGCSRR